MNKKFSTLVAALLLSTSVGTFTAQAASLITDSNIDKAYDAPGDKGYENGKAYLLKAGDGNYVSVEWNNTTQAWELVKKAGDAETLPELYKSLWTVTVVENTGAEPLYTFVNKYTQTVLSIDLEAAKANSAKFKANGDFITGATPKDLNYAMAGSITALHSAASYKQPKDNQNLYANIGGDKVVYLSAEKSDNNKIYALVANKSDFETSIKGSHLTITPYKMGDVVLSANDLNTLLYAGLPAGDAKATDYFDLTFNPAIASVFTDSKLQAVQVEHKELKYGKNGSNGADDYSNDEYASLVEVKDAYKSKTAGYVALKNVKGDYVVVDTAYVEGTDNNANGLLKITTDKLYNAKNETRLREPGSYLFKFTLNVTDQNVDIAVQKYVRASKTVLGATNAPDASATTTEDLEVFYGKDGGDYTKKFVVKGSNWYNNTVVNPGSSTDWYNKGGLWADGNYNSYNTGTGTATVDATRFITHVLLGTTDYVTIGVKQDETAATKSNIIDIKVGAQNIYVPTTMAEGAYLLQDVKSGKYLVDNLVGGVELVEQAVRQNFQHMPAAQWIVEANGFATTVTNREFENVYRTGILYKGDAADQAFFYGDNQFKFIKVEAAADEYLGYKYLDDAALKESRYTFNYLHDLAMDKPINTTNQKDSVVWVDKNDEAMNFSLIKVVDDEYGYTGNIKGVAKLKRRVYAIKVNDENKIINNGRFLTYDNGQKKYVVSKNRYDYFLLKENNEVEGADCYYTFLNANVPFVGQKAVASFQIREANGKKYFAENQFKNVEKAVNDGDVNGFYFLNATKVVNASGVLVDGYAPATEFVNKEYYEAYSDEFTAVSAAEYEAAGYTTETGKDNSVEVDGEVCIKTIDGEEYVLVYDILSSTPSNYASDKVSVDNNTLALVNGVLSDNNVQEVANSAFAVKPADSKLYRHIANVDTVKVFRVNSTEKEYLYEDATSKYSVDKGFNFLGVEDKGLTKDAAMFLDTAYVNRGTIMPQYMFVLRPTIQEADTIWCNATEAHKHETLEDSLACKHTTVLPKSVTGYYLVNLADSVAAENDRIAQAQGGILSNKYLMDKTNYTRLGFVKATHVGDSLIIANSIYTGNNRQIRPGYAETWASKDTINLAKNEHNNGVFSLRLVDDSDNFLLESEGTSKAPMFGGWVKIQNGVPVIANGTYDEMIHEAEVFNLESTIESPTANEEVEVSEVSVVAANGAVIVKGAAGKNVAISNILGQTIANTVVASDNATISVPAGIVVVAVEGEEAVKVVVK